MVNKVISGGFEAFCSMLMYRSESLYNRSTKETFIAALVYDRSLIGLKALTANMAPYSIKAEWEGYRIDFSGWYRQEFTPASFFTKVVDGYETINQAFVYEKNSVANILFVKDDNELMSQFFSYLMRTFSLPLLEKWMPYIYKRACEDAYIKNDIVIKYSSDLTIDLNGRKTKLSEMKGYSVNLVENTLEEYVKEGLENHVLSITDTWTHIPDLEFINMDSYFEIYGETIVRNLKTEVTPLMPLKGGVEEILLGGNKRLWKQQGAVVNGIANALRYKNTVLLNEGMGSGKTLQAISAIETYFVQKWLRSHPQKTLKDAYAHDGIINYRVVVMPPGHLVEKWKSEIEENVPFAKATILHELADLVSIKKSGKQRCGKEFFVIGKDFCKLSCTIRPAPYLYKMRHVVKFRCPNEDCQRVVDAVTYRNMDVCRCGMDKRAFKKEADERRRQIRGLACPECGEVLINSRYEPLGAADFANPTNLNDKCIYCGTPLWIPNVKNLGSVGREKKWYKISHFSNAKLKDKKTAWVLRGHEDSYKITLTEPVIKGGFEESKEMTCRKWAPARYIKTQLRGFFDVAVFDELHVYKGGGTAQGIAMHALVKASKKALGLTGTIAGGMANDLFYTLWRLAPSDMVRNGFKYLDETKFVEKYGTLETEFEVSNRSWNRNQMSKGNQLKAPSVKPGISPIIFQDFLVDKTVFLDLSDMSKHLPKLNEQVVKCDMDGELAMAYNASLNTIANAVGDNPGLGAGMLQFSLAYCDHPFNVGTIIDPTSGKEIVTPASLPEDTLYPKEKKLVELVNNEIDENRCCFVYAEYTGDERWKVTERLRDIMMTYCGLDAGEVQILESESPAAAKREAWIHKKAAEGVKVFICNPRVVETGLDFIFTEKGQTYNYPTIIFYQMGMNLFTLWQASRRAYRLNQTEECRTYYLCYDGTNQAKMVRLMAEKQIATAAIQGHFSMEGLAAMSSAVDPRVVLLNSLTKKSCADDKDDAEEATRIFTSLNEATGIDESVYGPSQTLLYSEVFGTAALDTDTSNAFDAFDVLELFGESEEKEEVVLIQKEEHTDSESDEDDFFDDFFGDFFSMFGETGSTVKTEEPKKVRKRKSVNEDQISLLDLLG